MKNKNRLSGVLLPCIFLAAMVSACNDKQAKAQAAEARYDEAVLAEIVRREKDRDRAAAASAARSEQPAAVPAPSQDEVSKDAQAAS